MVQLISSIVPLATLASTALALPFTPAKRGGNFKIGVGLPQERSLPPLVNTDGSFNKNSFQAHSTATRAKYADNLARAKANKGVRAKRASGSIDLSDSYEAEAKVDNYYYGPSSLGTPGQELPFDFDTGSADIWVPGSDLGSGGFFKSDDSSSFKSTGKNFTIQYGSGTVSGTDATDVVAIGDLKVENQTFAVADTISDNFVGSEFAGIFGLAFSSIAQTEAPTFVENLVSAKALDKNVFGFFLARGGVDGSELSIGTTDDSKYTGDIGYTKVTTPDYWEVQLGAPVVGGKAAGDEFKGAIDTGTTLIYAPAAVAKAIWGAVPGAALDEADSDPQDDLYSYDCDSKPDIAFTFDGLDGNFSISPDDLSIGTTSDGKCVGAIIGSDFIQDRNGESISIVGDVFLKSWYSAYDLDTPAVGFAQAKH